MLRHTLAAIERHPAAALIVSIAALAVSLTGAAVATIPARDGDVHACYSTRTGDIELVNTQRDRFSCEQNWRGLTLDTTPTKLVSPNGDFKVEVTNGGASLTGPQGSVTVGGAGIAVNGTGRVEVRSSGILDLRGARVDINGVAQSGD